MIGAMPIKTRHRFAWTVVAADLATRGKNTPLLGRELRGRVVHAVVGGEVRYEGAVFAGA